ncbi:hypothetical protein IGB42_01832 [Andreprevotia sp. IGB-42]|uniref:hypothetical protein n=1 Tax=Andreprevotia sp. IGB-42 TaxID=2497473 RepID=UPI00135A0BBC|nr:hypothetical protein [Andreprevotia sp. IGB-42]KAF0813481.1 hypothetical protein IGB42_01832 [Andreprevotia sp. IGB-42]
MTIEQQLHEARVKSAACAYLIDLLLQRAEVTQPGLIQALMDGVAADQAGVDEDISEKPFIDDIFAETQKILKRANGPWV